jgi:hypothetical protein
LERAWKAKECLTKSTNEMQDELSEVTDRNFAGEDKSVSNPANDEADEETNVHQKEVLDTQNSMVHAETSGMST